MKKEEFTKRCKETRDAFLSDNEIEKAVETLYFVGAIEENETDNHYLNVYSMMAMLFQKAADYCLHGATRARLRSSVRLPGTTADSLAVEWLIDYERNHNS